MAGKLSKKVLVRANVSHDGLRAGKVYKLLDTDDLRRRESQKLVSVLEDVEPDEKAPTTTRTSTRRKDTTEPPEAPAEQPSEPSEDPS